jgi:hypothetical protein
VSVPAPQLNCSLSAPSASMSYPSPPDNFLVVVGISLNHVISCVALQLIIS